MPTENDESKSPLGARMREARSRRRERHRPSGFRFAIADRIGFLLPSHWDALTARSSFFLSRRYLRVLEEQRPDELEPRYAIVFRETEPVAAIVTQVLRVPATQLIGGRGKRKRTARRKRSEDGRSEAADGQEPSARSSSDRERGEGLRRAVDPLARGVKASVGKVKEGAEQVSRGVGRLRRRALSRLSERVLICGNVLTWGAPGVAFAEGEDTDSIWPGVAEALYRIRRAERLAGQTDFVLVKDFDEATARSARTLERFSYTALETEPNMVLELPPEVDDYDGYLDSLNARYRKTARRIVKDVAAAGLVVERLESLDRDADAIHRLYLSVHAEARVRLVTVCPGYLPALARAAPDAFRMTVVRRHDELVGFVSTLRDGDEAIGYLIGFDREINASAPIYFRLLQAVVADALELGCRRISLGRTALEPKARLGARPVPQTVFLRHRVPLLNAFVRRVLRGIEHDEPPERSPFTRG